jgi:hypothetical protein
MTPKRERSAATSRKIAWDVARVEFRNRRFRLALAVLIWPAGWSHTKVGVMTDQKAATSVRLDDHKPLLSVGLVCTCGRALASMELAARACACGRVWLISVSQIGGPE